MDAAGIFATSFARDAALVRTRPQQIALALFLVFLLLGIVGGFIQIFRIVNKKNV